jgi:segregation and condensation protein A
MPVAVRELPLDLDAFEGPFDLLLTLVLKEELELVDVDVAEIVLAFVERLEERGTLDLDACGEFLVLVAALLELKARGLFPDGELDLEDLDPDEAASELAERLAAYRRFRAAAGWLEEKLESESERFFRTGPAPLAPVPARPLARQDPELLATALRALAAEPAEPSLGHLVLSYPPLSRFLDRFRALLRGRGGFAFDHEVDGLTRPERIVAFLALLELRKRGEVSLGQTAPFEPITVWNATSAS